MAKIVSSIKAACHQVAENRKATLAGLGVIAGSLLIQGAAAAPEDYSFLNDTLQGVGTAIMGVLPLVGEIVTTGGPVVIKTAVYICIAAPFVAVAFWLHKKI